MVWPLSRFFFGSFFFWGGGGGGAERERKLCIKRIIKKKPALFCERDYEDGIQESIKVFLSVVQWSSNQ